jgi:NTP pyrophosphatase (non-canonical NTP hydrolase)
MDLNPLAKYVYEVIEEKGFHGIDHPQIETLTFRQLLHLVTEWGEMMQIKHGLTYSGRPKSELLAQLYEEGADILIVALDLAAMHHLDLNVPVEGMPVGILDQMYVNIPILIGKLGDGYRKQRVLDQELLIEMIALVAMILKRHGADPIAEVKRKMAKNARRPTRYGTKEVAA